MSRILEICHDGRESSFSITRISRSRLYGAKRRIPVDGQGNECSRASLTRDGMFILPYVESVLMFSQIINLLKFKSHSLYYYT
jgi:hypothetical protein